MPSTERRGAPGSSSVDTAPAPRLDRRPHWIRSRPLAVTNLSYGALYAVDGALLPFLSVYLAFAHGFSPGQIGLVLAVSSGAAVLAPPVITMLADRFGRAEVLLLWMLAASSAALLAFTLVGGFWPILVVYTAFSLAREPARPLLDGIFFSAQRSIPALAGVSYHRVRIWGTFGFMVPGLCLYFILGVRDSLDFLPLLSCVLAIVGLLVTFMLPTRQLAVPARARREGPARPAGGTTAAGARPPTSRALVRSAGSLLRRPSTALFVLAMFLLQASMSAYFAFYPLQATQVVGLSPRWLGLVTNLGVALELGYMAAFGWLVARLGWRWLMVLGALGAAVRVALLGAFPTVGVIVGTQALHGLVIIVSMVAGRVILDRHAPDEIRHTAQGLYAMIVLGGGKIAGSALGGLVAAKGLSTVFWSAAGVAAVAAVVLAYALREDPPDPPTSGPVVEPVVEPAVEPVAESAVESARPRARGGDDDG